VCVNVCLCVSPAKTAESIEMLFGLWTWMGQRNQVLGKGPNLPGRGDLGDMSRPIVKYRVTQKVALFPYTVSLELFKKKLNRFRQNVARVSRNKVQVAVFFMYC